MGAPVADGRYPGSIAYIIDTRSIYIVLYHRYNISILSRISPIPYPSIIATVFPT
jgi:hypothetical protein